jgi:hypothetical protein
MTSPPQRGHFCGTERAAGSCCEEDTEAAKLGCDWVSGEAGFLGVVFLGVLAFLRVVAFLVAAAFFSEAACFFSSSGLT